MQCHINIIFGRWVLIEHMHKTIQPTIVVGCHGNQEAANQAILAHNLILEQKALRGFCT